MRIVSKVFLLFCILSLMSCQKDPQIQAAYDLIERITPGYSQQFSLELIEPENGNDVYEVAGENGKVVLRGNNTVSLATAYNQYLKYHCNAHVSWFGDQLNLPATLPVPAETKVFGIIHCFVSVLQMRKHVLIWSIRPILPGSGCLISKALADRCRNHGLIRISLWVNKW